jgi:hypothetical protein
MKCRALTKKALSKVENVCTFVHCPSRLHENDAILFPHLAQGLVDDETLARNIGGVIFFVSFLLANFNLYRKLSSEVPSTNVLNEDSLLMYPYANPPSNSIEIRYVGQETIKDLNVKMIYKDKAGIDKEQEIVQFFPENDRKMGLHSSRGQC